MPGSVLRSERFTISVECGEDRRKLMICQFAKRDGSIFLSFPYFQHTEGVTSLVSWPGGPASTTLSLEPGGRVSSHLVKYSHHPSGRAHFSQDGRVLTLIKKSAVPLAELTGHLFTLHVHGLNAFEPLSEAEAGQPPSASRTGVRFTLGPKCPQSIKLVGMLYRDTELERRAVGGMVHPVMTVHRPDGTSLSAFVCSTPLGRMGQERCLLVYCEQLPRLDLGRESSMLFIGGFDSAAHMDDLDRDVTFLAFSYPADNLNELRQQLGTIDLAPPNHGLQPTAARRKMRPPRLKPRR